MTPDILAGLRQAWPDPDAESALALDVIGETLAINQLFLTNQNWESNERRAQLNRRNFLRHWNEVKTAAPRVMLKFGASHMDQEERPGADEDRPRLRRHLGPDRQAAGKDALRRCRVPALR